MEGTCLIESTGIGIKCIQILLISFKLKLILWQNKGTGCRDDTGQNKNNVRIFFFGGINARSGLDRLIF